MVSRFDINAHLVWERNLKPGDTVEARWTNSYRYYDGRAEVVRINSKSVRVKLLESVQGVYPAGRELSIATFMSMDRWSDSNGVFPTEERA